LLIINLFIWVWVLISPQQVGEQQQNPTAQAVPNNKPLATAKTVVSILEQPQAGKERKSDPPLVTEARIAPEVDEKTTPKAAAMPVTPEPVMSSQDTETTQPAGIAAQAHDAPKDVAVAADAPEQAEQTVIAAQHRLAKVSEPQVPAEQPLETRGHPEIKQDEAEQIPMLWELPANVQEKLSDLKINILVYDEDTARRFVIINMRKYREGDQLIPSGMRLQRITRKGVVIDYGDGLVRL
jgi:hypothetical protein